MATLPLTSPYDDIINSFEVSNNRLDRHSVEGTEYCDRSIGGRDMESQFHQYSVATTAESIREQIATLTNHVTYDPTDDVGELVVGTVQLSVNAIDPAFDHLERLHESSIGPILMSETDDRSHEGIELAFPSSISLDGVLLSHGIDSGLITAGLVEYDGELRRYIDAGAINLRRPRETGPFPAGNPSWDFVSLTYIGASETAISLLSEHGLVEEWESLAEIRPRSAFEPVLTARQRF